MFVFGDINTIGMASAMIAARLSRGGPFCALRLRSNRTLLDIGAFGIASVSSRTSPITLKPVGRSSRPVVGNARTTAIAGMQKTRLVEELLAQSERLRAELKRLVEKSQQLTAEVNALEKEAKAVRKRPKPH